MLDISDTRFSKAVARLQIILIVFFTIIIQWFDFASVTQNLAARRIKRVSQCQIAKPARFVNNCL